ncbi:hypothetical protein L6452_08036 [Arctium lappa]|uniref:Uncharacterized protein n=1 Tax=Arctium lappa TaxID=4217 RepID=A0ACB9DGI8_ARCLA|nr:hypothetical protein L6452_08036 [Arctium lappa]
MGTKRKDLDDKRVNVQEHKNDNERNICVVPTEVDGWLEKVRKLEEKAASISDDAGSCFNITRRHKLGRKAFNIIEEINSLIQGNDRINWTDRRIPPAKVNSKKTSTSTPSSHHNDFPSRERTFMEALGQLQPDHKSRIIALCGMGGVGKTTMMENLKKDAEEKNFFNMIVKVAIGEKTDPIVIQQSVADFLGIDLKESDKGARAINLRKSFEAASDGGKKKILVILDDVWEFLDLNDIGLSPLPNHGVGIKILLTSRIRDVCIRMEVDSIFDVETVEDHEAQSFFHQCVQIPEGGDLDFDLHVIGNDIANRCHGLPIAIKTIAGFLKCYRSDKWVWENTLSSLKNKEVEEVVYKIFEISYNHLQNEEIRSTLLLCGVFPEDFDTPREDLVRYGWGLRLFKNVHTIREARNRLNTCIEQLINANLLIQSQLVNHVKMHDLVRAFVLKVCSNSEHASIVGDISKWTEENTSEFCKRISLTCTGISEFPRNLNFPNLSLLKLMHGDESLKFPEHFYEGMKKLQVIAYDVMEYPLLSRSLACSTNLRTLCLHRCLLMYDCYPIGDLLNLEVLSFAYGILRKLPSTVRNLKELKLLDLTGCVDLIIDDGVLKNLINLEELYVKVGSTRGHKKAIRFTDSICIELAELSKNLFALEIEFFDNNALPKNMSFKKLERFKISLGCFLKDDDGPNRHSYENTLMLVIDKCELLDSRMNQLLEKTEVLHLQVNDVNNLGDGLVESLHHQRSSFYNIRVLKICKCDNLRYLFTVCVANDLTKLERLTILECPVLETLVGGERGELGVIKFQALKFLSLGKLPKLMSLCNVGDAIELPQLEELILDGLPNFTSIYPDYYKLTTSSISSDISTMQSFIKKEVVIPKLKKLHVSNMENLKEICPCEFGSSEEVNDSVVNLFLSNPMSLLHHLEELKVEHCGSVEVLFNIDLRCVGKNEEVGSCLRSIQVWDAENLREVWRIKGANDDDLSFNGFQAIESIEIKKCKRFRNVFTPTTTNFDMRALAHLKIKDCGENEKDDEMVNSKQEQEIDVAFSSSLIHTFHNLQDLNIENYKGAEVEVVFEIESPSSRELATTPQSNQQPLLLPYLQYLVVVDMKRTSHVWKCNWNKFLIPQKQQPKGSSSSFHNLTIIYLWRCKSIKYLFSPLMAKLLSNLKEVDIWNCDVIEEVVSNRDDEAEELVASTNTRTILLPHLDELNLRRLPNLKRIGGGSGAKRGGKEISSTTPIHDQSKEEE